MYCMVIGMRGSSAARLDNSPANDDVGSNDAIKHESEQVCLCRPKRQAAPRTVALSAMIAVNIYAPGVGP